MDARKLHSPKTLKQTLETPLLGDSRSSISVRLFVSLYLKWGLSTLLKEPHCLSIAQPTGVYLMAFPRHFLKDREK